MAAALSQKQRLARHRCYISALHWPAQPGLWQIWSQPAPITTAPAPFDEAVVLVHQAIKQLRMAQPDRHRYMLWTRHRETAIEQSVAQILWIGGSAGPGLQAHKLGWVSSSELLDVYIGHMGLMSS